MKNDVLELDVTDHAYKAILENSKLIIINELTKERSVYALETKKPTRPVRFTRYPNVKIWATKRGIRFSDIAERLGISPAVLSHAVCGRRTFDENWKPIVSRMLNVSEEVLFYGKK